MCSSAYLYNGELSGWIRLPPYPIICLCFFLFILGRNWHWRLSPLQRLVLFELSLIIFPKYPKTPDAILQAFILWWFKWHGGRIMKCLTNVCFGVMLFVVSFVKHQVQTFPHILPPSCSPCYPGWLIVPNLQLSSACRMCSGVIGELVII